MKKLLTLSMVLTFTVGVFTQAPQKISYQAVIRNGDDALVTNTTVGMQISILQGTPSGTVVYAETQTPTTNANGLITIEIGAGTIVLGTFAGIIWSNDIYFIKTEIDPSGGTDYTITGTNQLLSVPYALHAKTAESVNGYGNSHYVGELYGGGVVFWVDHNAEHGLILSMVTLSTNQAWSNVTSTLIGTTNDWDGITNTTSITGQSGHTSSAANLCEDYTNADYGSGTFSDWYLPSIAELNHLWNNFYEVQKALTNDGNASTMPLIKNPYWSSTESELSMAWTFHLLYGSPYGYPKSAPYYVRAVRAF